jgi:hypothetical protein
MQSTDYDYHYTCRHQVNIIIIIIKFICQLSNTIMNDRRKDKKDDTGTGIHLCEAS